MAMVGLKSVMMVYFFLCFVVFGRVWIVWADGKSFVFEGRRVWLTSDAVCDSKHSSGPIEFNLIASGSRSRSKFE